MALVLPWPEAWHCPSSLCPGWGGGKQSHDTKHGQLRLSPSSGLEKVQCKLRERTQFGLEMGTGHKQASQLGGGRSRAWHAGLSGRCRGAAAASVSSSAWFPEGVVTGRDGKGRGKAGRETRAARAAGHGRPLSGANIWKVQEVGWRLSFGEHVRAGEREGVSAPGGQSSPEALGTQGSFEGE